MDYLSHEDSRLMDGFSPEWRLLVLHDNAKFRAINRLATWGIHAHAPQAGFDGGQLGKGQIAAVAPTHHSVKDKPTDKRERRNRPLKTCVPMSQKQQYRSLPCGHTDPGFRMFIVKE
jgi:hypothetical protein